MSTRDAEKAAPRLLEGAPRGPVRVVLAGATGRMGREVISALASVSDAVLVAAVSRCFGGEGEAAEPLREMLAGGGVRTYGDLRDGLAAERPDVLVEFTTAAIAGDNISAALEAGVIPVSGTTGLPAADLAEIAELAGRLGTGAAVVPNFSLGAAVLSMVAGAAAAHFRRAEIVEYHHDLKRDAPSGTALALARVVGERLKEKNAGLGETPPSRGLLSSGVPIHSVRLAGLVAHHEVIFASDGETLTLRHDSVSRASFMPGLLLTIRRAHRLRGLVTSLAEILALPETSSG